MFEPDYLELTYYTLSHPDPAFIHQQVVDAQTAQTATTDTKPLALTFALTGLFLYLEKGFTGKEVQDFHVFMSKNKTTWPDLFIPERNCTLSVHDVLQEQPGITRDQKIREWCLAVWASYLPVQSKLKNFLSEKGFFHQTGPIKK
ncbi:MAG: DUF5946 family protein [Haliscomenobacter sp.]